MTKSDLEAMMALHLRIDGNLPPPELEYAFHPKRKWRFDFAWPAERVAVEVQGGIYMKRSGHNSPAGITRDCEKGNEAICEGWRVLHVTAAQIESGAAIDWIRRALQRQGVERAPMWGSSGKSAGDGSEGSITYRRNPAKNATDN